MSTYIVTGAAGFIASKVAEFLLAEGHRVCGVDNVNDSYDVRLKDWRLQRLMEKQNFDFHRLDIGDRSVLATLGKVASQADAVIHLAARAGVRQSLTDPWMYIDANITGTLNLLELCRACEIKRFVLASSSSLYGKCNPVPYREDTDTSRPLSPYAASKKAAEALCHTYHSLYGIDIAVLRYFTVYGPAGRPDMSPFRFVQWISEGRPVVVYGNGDQSRDFTYVDDIARGTVAALKSKGYEIFNLGSDRPVALVDTIRLIEKLVGRRAEVEFRAPQPGDVTATWADISRADNHLGWRPTIGYENGFERAVDWYRENRQWASEINTSE